MSVSTHEVLSSSDSEGMSSLSTDLTCGLRAKRGTWSHSLAFVLAVMSSCIGFGNLWVFPFNVYAFGGAAFIVVYWLMFFLVFYPAFFMELSLGQFCSVGPLHLYRYICPAMQPVGLTCVFSSCIVAFYYTGLVAHAVTYFFYATSSPMPWETCTNHWNSNFCFLPTAYVNCVGKNENSKWYLKNQCYDDTNFRKFYEILDGCFGNADSSFSEGGKTKDMACSVVIEFQSKELVTVLSNYTRSVLESQDLVRIFRLYSKTYGNWYFPTGQKSLDPTENEKLRLDLSKESLIPVRKLQHMLSSNGENFTLFVQKYCSQVGGKKFSWIECSRKILHPSEVFSSEEYYDHLLNRKGASLRDLKGLRTVPVFSLAFCWLIVAVGVGSGPNWLGRGLMVTAVLPFILLFIHLIHAATLDGFLVGLKQYIKMDPWRFGDPKLWLFAARTVCFSLSLGAGQLTLLASCNPPQNDIVKDSVAVAVGDSLYSFIAGFGIFGVLGFFSSKLHVPVETLVQDRDLASVVFIQAATLMSQSRLWTMVYFGTVILVSITCSIITVETLLSSFLDQFPKLRPLRLWAVALFCTGGFTLGLSFVSGYGMKMVVLLDSAVNDFLFPLCMLTQMVTVVYLYGIRRFINDVTLMLGRKRLDTFRLGNWVWTSWLRYYYIGTLLFTAPIGILATFLATLVKNFPDRLNQYSEDQWTVYGLIVVFFPAACGTCLVYRIFYLRLPFRQMFSYSEIQSQTIPEDDENVEIQSQTIPEDEDENVEISENETVSRF